MRSSQAIWQFGNLFMIRWQLMWCDLFAFRFYRFPAALFMYLSRHTLSIPHTRLKAHLCQVSRAVKLSLVERNGKQRYSQRYECAPVCRQMFSYIYLSMSSSLYQICISFWPLICCCWPILGISCQSSRRALSNLHNWWVWQADRRSR